MNTDNEILSKIKATVTKQAPSAKVILYGSRAKGTAHEQSDWDILILVDKKITPELEESITFPLYDLEFETGKQISPSVYNEQEWNSKYSVTPFFKNVAKNGILL